MRLETLHCTYLTHHTLNCLKVVMCSSSSHEMHQFNSRLPSTCEHHASAVLRCHQPSVNYKLPHNSASHQRIYHLHLAYGVLIGVVQVLTEIAGETLEQMAAAPKNKTTPSRVVAAPEEEEEEDTEAADLQARLNAIRS